MNMENQRFTRELTQKHITAGYKHNSDNDAGSEKPINTDVAKPCKKRKLSKSNKEQKIMVLAGIVTSNLSKEDPLHCLYQEDSHA